MFISTRKSNFLKRLWIIAFDIFSIWGSIYLATLIRFGSGAAGEYISEKLLPLSLSMFLFITLFYLNGLYELNSFRKYTGIILKIALSVLAGFLLTSFLFYAAFSFAIGRGVFVLIILFSIVLVSIPRVFYIFVVQNKMMDKNLMIIGTKKAASDVIALIKRHPSSRYRASGILSENVDDLNVDNISGCKILGSVNNISDVIKRGKFSSIVVTTLEPGRNNILRNLRICRYRGIEIIDDISLYEDLEKRIPVEHIDDEWLFSSNVNYPKFHIRKMKRLVDILVSVTGIIVTFPLCLVVYFLVKFDSKGSAFYRQKRVGRYGKVFRMLKFRSMIDKAEKNTGGPVWAQKNDSRVTRIGRFLRKTRIDEIPQLLNVLTGQMSLVGPRPERPVFVKELSEKIPFYPERLYTQPGLTGWAQIKYPYAASIEDTKKKLQYDLYYIKHVSFFFDLSILIKTAGIMLSRRGT